MLENKQRKKRKSQAKFECPPKLAAILAEARFFDAKTKWIPGFYDEDPNGWNFREPHPNNPQGELWKIVVFRRFLKLFPNDLTAYLNEMIKPHKLPDENNQNPTWDELYAVEPAIKAHYELKFRRDSLRELTKLCEEASTWIDEKWNNGEEWETSDFIGYFTTGNVDDQRSKLIFKDKKVVNKQNPFAEAVNDIRIDRLRFCKVCSHVFWANRKDAKTCGEKKCFNTLKKRNQRRNKTLKQKF